MAKAEYGIPYMGSKSSICEALIKVFPEADNFYDLFGGGFSVSHAMLLNRPKDFKAFHFNEIRPGICDLIKRAIAGDFNYDRFKPPFISSSEFKEMKDKDAYIKIVWSFGNSGTSYMFSKEIEPIKRSLHQAVVFNEFDKFATEVFGRSKFEDHHSITDRRLFLRDRVRALKRKTTDVEQLEQLQQLQQLQQLERLQRLDFHSSSYDEIKILPNSVIYCDPPYAGTANYDDQNFDHKKFLDWCASQSNPVFISEYSIKDDRFRRVFMREKLVTLTPASRNKREELIYANKPGMEILWQRLRARHIKSHQNDPSSR